ncbi:MAG: glycosyltransferase [Lachnospiraceae bacterium]|nr:glycosyltransferase [Lachnospiraceae bacterium]
MKPISVCMIAKNEEKYLAKCLSLLRPHFTEIIVVDTGSTDKTVAIAKEYADKVCHFDWINDFSAARNFSLRQASNDWVLVVDCDEFLEDIDMAEILKLAVKCPQAIGMIIRNNPYESENQPKSILTERVARLFDRRIHHYQGIIHEQVLPIDGSEPQYFPIPLSFYHEGYVNPTTAAEKANRNLDLLFTDLNKNGPDPYTYFQIAQSYTALNETEEAYKFYGMALEFDLDPLKEYVRTMVESYGYALLNLKLYAEALNFENIYHEFATRADFLFLMGLIYMNNALFDQAIAEFKKATTMKEFAVAGVNSYSAYYNIGVIYECTGNAKLAREYYQKCGNYAPAMERLASI